MLLHTPPFLESVLWDLAPAAVSHCLSAWLQIASYPGPFSDFSNGPGYEARLQTLTTHP